MGFWTDLGNFAVGAIERDRENTAAKFEIRKEELIANRNALIENRKKKYELEIKEFEEQNKKNKVVKNLNAKYADFKNEKGEVSQEGAIAWGRDYLMETNPALITSLTNLYKDRPNELNKALANYAKRYTDFGVTGTRDDLFKTQEDDISRITTEYSEKLKNAKGDSFLIGKLVGERNDKINKINNTKANAPEVAGNPRKDYKTPPKDWTKLSAQERRDNWDDIVKDTLARSKANVKNL